MDINSSPKAIDALVDFISDFVRENFRTGRKTDGAYLAKAIFQEGYRLPEMGIRLSEAVSLAEDKGLVVRNRGVQHLEVVPSQAPEVNQEEIKYERLPSVRPELWRALVFVSQQTRLFINKTNGKLVSEDNAANPSLSDQPEWVLVEPIPPDTQKKWMHVLVSEHPGLSIEQAPTDDHRWWEAFPAWLRANDPRAEFEWRRYRTQKVVEYLREWAKRKDIPLHFLFAAFHTTKLENSTGTSGFDVDATRRAIIAAVSEMPLEELERLSIPLRYVTRYFSAR